MYFRQSLARCSAITAGIKSLGTRTNPAESNANATNAVQCLYEHLRREEKKTSRYLPRLIQKGHIEMNLMKELKKFVKERDEALFSLDREKIERYMRKYEVCADPESIPDVIFWASVHKAICNNANATYEQKMKSALWLRKFSMSSSML